MRLPNGWAPLLWIAVKGSTDMVRRPCTPTHHSLGPDGVGRLPTHPADGRKVRRRVGQGRRRRL